MHTQAQVQLPVFDLEIVLMFAFVPLTNTVITKTSVKVVDCDTGAAQ